MLWDRIKSGLPASRRRRRGSGAGAMGEPGVGNLVCVLCGEPWEPMVKNRCECGGFCTWGPAKGAKPSSWREDGSPEPVPQDVLDAVRTATTSDTTEGTIR